MRQDSIKEQNKWISVTASASDRTNHYGVVLSYSRSRLGLFLLGSIGGTDEAWYREFQHATFVVAGMISLIRVIEVWVIRLYQAHMLKAFEGNRRE